MAGESTRFGATEWRNRLPSLRGRGVALREPAAADVDALVALLSIGDATRFGLEQPVSDPAVNDLIDRSRRDRASGLAFTYVIVLGASRSIVGLVQVRQLDLAFENAEWECTVHPSFRGTGVFFEAARLVGSFVFGAIGARRLEARAPLLSGRVHGALRKLGAVQEGVLRRAVRRDGEYFDQALWSLLKEDWDELWASEPRVH